MAILAETGSDRLNADATFTVVPKMIHSIGLSDSAFRLYVILCGYADNETGVSWPSRGKLAEIMGKTRKTVDRGLAELEAAGVVTRVARYGDDGHQTSNLYTVRRVIGSTQGSDIRDATPSTSVSSPPPHGCRTELDLEELDSEELVAHTSKRRKANTEMPDRWRPSQDALDRLAARWPKADLEDHLENFVGWTTAKAQRYANWDTAFANHVKRDEQRKIELMRRDGLTVDEQGRVWR